MMDMQARRSVVLPLHIGWTASATKFLKARIKRTSDPPIFILRKGYILPFIDMLWSHIDLIWQSLILNIMFLHRWQWLEAHISDGIPHQESCSGFRLLRFLIRRTFLVR